MVWNYQNADGSLKIICVIHYNFRHTFVPYTCSMDLLLCSSLFHQLYQEAAACFWAAEQKRWRMRITGITSVRQNPAQWRQLTSISSRTWDADADGLRPNRMRGAVCWPRSNEYGSASRTTATLSSYTLSRLCSSRPRPSAYLWSS